MESLPPSDLPPNARVLNVHHSNFFNLLCAKRGIRNLWTSVDAKKETVLIGRTLNRSTCLKELNSQFLRYDEEWHEVASFHPKINYLIHILICIAVDTILATKGILKTGSGPILANNDLFSRTWKESINISNCNHYKIAKFQNFQRQGHCAFVLYALTIYAWMLGLE